MTECYHLPSFLLLLSDYYLHSLRNDKAYLKWEEKFIFVISEWGWFAAKECGTQCKPTYTNFFTFSVIYLQEFEQLRRSYELRI